MSTRLVVWAIQDLNLWLFRVREEVGVLGRPPECIRAGQGVAASGGVRPDTPLSGGCGYHFGYQ